MDSKAFVTQDARWLAVLRRDPTADFAFYYSVKTTGVYCKPSCGSRLPRRENVHFHDTRADAEKAGFRPCKRCKPDKPSSLEASSRSSRIRFATTQCSLGTVLVAATERGICAVLLDNDSATLERDLQQRFPNATLTKDTAGLMQRLKEITAFIEVPRKGLDLPLDVSGTPFQQRVWRALRKIPVGSTVSYTQIAQTLGVPNAVRAVAQACAANALAVVIPCHRVVRSDGNLSGYRWGVERKRALLRREASAEVMPLPLEQRA